MSKTILCPYCKRPIQSEDEKCKHCGKDLSKKKRLLLYLLPAMSLILVPMVTFAAYSGYRYMDVQAELSQGKTLMGNERYVEAGEVLAKAAQSRPTRGQQQDIAAERALLTQLVQSDEAFSQGIMRINGAQCGDAVAHLKGVKRISPKYRKAQELISGCANLEFDRTENASPGEARVLNSVMDVVDPDIRKTAQSPLAMPAESKYSQPEPSYQEDRLEKLGQRIQIIKEALKAEAEMLRQEERGLGQKELSAMERERFIEAIKAIKQSMEIHKEELRHQEAVWQSATTDNP